MKYILLSLALLVLSLPVQAKSSDKLGVHDGKLVPCPSSPNCVSSQSEDKRHRIKAMHLNGSASEALAKMIAAVQHMDGARIVTAGDNYLHAEYTSTVMRFVDDVELLFEPATGTVQIRSASRIGYYDWGANRRRAEAIRKALAHEEGMQ